MDEATSDPTPPLSPPTPRVVETTWAVETQSNGAWQVRAATKGMMRRDAVRALAEYRLNFPKRPHRLVRRETTETVEDV